MTLKISDFYIWYFTILVFNISLGPVRCDEALLFDRKGRMLVQKLATMDNESEHICGNCVTACPAFTREELKYNYRESAGKKVLFRDTIYKQFQDINEIELPQCNRSVQPSIVFDTVLGVVEVGYEIHDRLNIIESTLQRKGEHGNLLPLYPSDPEEAPNPMEVLSNYFNSNKNVEENQKTLFTGSENQSTAPSEMESISSEEEFKCGQKYGCLVQHQVIPSYYLHSNYGTLATCTHLNTVPIWESIVERINIVNRYLYAITQLYQPNIHIHLINGFFDIFKLTAKYFQIPVPERDLYLDQHNNIISVPMILYKIVEYKIRPKLPRDTPDFYFAVIIIHNDPTPNAGVFRICERDSKIPGWEFIENEESESGLTYVCALNTNVAEKLDLFDKDYIADRSPLRLDEFPTYDPEINFYSHRNARMEIKEKVEELFA